MLQYQHMAIMESLMWQHHEPILRTSRRKSHSTESGRSAARENKKALAEEDVVNRAHHFAVTVAGVSCISFS